MERKIDRTRSSTITVFSASVESYSLDLKVSSDEFCLSEMIHAFTEALK